MHADQGEPTRRERGYATMQLAGPDVFGFSPAGRALGALPARQTPAAPRPAGATSLSTPRGTFEHASLEQVELDTWHHVQAVNVESALLLAQAFAPGMRDRGFGRVIFIVSNTFWSPPAGNMLPYVASKGALIGMARTLAVGLGRDGIAVTAVAPGLTHTPATATRPEAEFAATEARQALHQPLTPDDTAAAVAMLARDDSAALTGQTLTVDGALVMR